MEGFSETWYRWRPAIDVGYHQLKHVTAKQTSCPLMDYGILWFIKYVLIPVEPVSLPLTYSTWFFWVFFAGKWSVDFVNKLMLMVKVASAWSFFCTADPVCVLQSWVVITADELICFHSHSSWTSSHSHPASTPAFSYRRDNQHKAGWDCYYLVLYTRCWTRQ